MISSVQLSLCVCVCVKGKLPSSDNMFDITCSAAMPLLFYFYLFVVVVALFCFRSFELHKMLINKSI